MQKAATRSIVSPFVAVTYALVAFTGLLMLFHLTLPGMHSLHQWAGILFVIGSVIHLVLNWKAFKSYFKNRKALIGALAGVLAVIFILLAFPSRWEGEGYHERSRSISSHGAFHHK